MAVSTWLIPRIPPTMKWRMCPAPPEEGPLFHCLKAEMRARLADAITALPERERMVLTLYYYEEMTMKEIGLTLDVVESRVSQIHTSAVLHLRSLLANVPATATPRAKSQTGWRPLPGEPSWKCACGSWSAWRRAHGTGVQSCDSLRRERANG